jgi:SRSO17 transposase
MSDVILGDVVEQVEVWAGELAGWMDRVAPVFSRPEPREVFSQMVGGLLSGLPKKNGWTLAEYAGHTHPGRVQTFLCRGAWDAAGLEARVRDLVVAEMGDPDAVLIVDDTQMIKKGAKSVGVAPQHCGATNQIENCQVVVMLTYASALGHAFVGHRLYLPERWTSDPDRCREAGVAKDVEFATKPEQAVELLAEADEAKVPYRWVAADGGYGQYRVVRDWCTSNSRRYVLAVPSSQPLARVHAIAGQARVKRADDLLGRATRWERRSCGHGSKGERYYDWAFFTITLPDEPAADGFEHTLLIRRSIADPSEVAYFLAHAPAATPVNDMVSVAGIRWRIEECNEQGKDLFGLDQHQVRTWTAFHHHVAVCVFAHAFAATRRAHQQRLATTLQRRALPAHTRDAGDTSPQTGEGAHRGNDPAPTPAFSRKPFPGGGS